MEFRSRPGIPSTTISGELFPNVAFPRIRIVPWSLPGSPLLCMMVAPGNFPAKALETLPTGDDLMDSLDTVLTEPIRLSFLVVPYPITIISSSTDTSLSKATRMIELAEDTVTSWVIYPIYDTTSIFLPDSGTETSKDPSSFVIVPRVVPLSTILTPGSPSPLSSVTWPFTATSAFV